MTLDLFLFAWLAVSPSHPSSLSFLKHSTTTNFFHPLLSIFLFGTGIYVRCRILLRRKRSVQCITQIILCCNIIWPLCLCGKCYCTYSYSFSAVFLSHTNHSHCSVTVCEGTGWYWAQGQYPSAPYKQTSHWTQHTHLNLHTGTLTFIVCMPVSCCLRVVYTSDGSFNVTNL